MRYSRQIAFADIGCGGQEMISRASVAVVGCGGLGSVVCEMLVRAGVAAITIFDDDRVEISNLQRQSLFSESDVGEFKAVAAREKLSSINSGVAVVAKVLRIGEEFLSGLHCDIVLDCTDNMESRRAINLFCHKAGIPVVFCSVAGAKGFVLPVLPSFEFCFSCVFGEASVGENCESIGILNAAAHALAALQVSFALKIITGAKVDPFLIHLDIWNLELSKFRVSRKKSCGACGNF